MKVAILSDIHGNLSALFKVLEHCKNKYGNLEFIHLGDCVDYGMRPNEVISELKKLPILFDLKGNHERAILGFEDDRFSSPRGAFANQYTKKILKKDSLDYINSMKDDFIESNINDKKVLLIHGDLSDIYWGKMKDDEIQKEIYSRYDIVISGHTHVSSMREVLDKTNKRKTLFINPGSIGQPRNLNSNAQYCVIDFKNLSVYFESVQYDIDFEQSLYKGEIDIYYKERLKFGI